MAKEVRKQRPEGWPIVCALIKKYKFLVRVCLTDGTITDWSSWLIEPVPPCIETTYGPVRKEDVKWIEIDAQKKLEDIENELNTSEVFFVRSQSYLHINTRKFKL